MEYLTKGLKSVLGTPDAANELPTGADTVIIIYLITINIFHMKI